MKPLGPALLLVLSFLACDAMAAEPPAAMEARLEPAIASARDTRDRLDAAATDPAPDGRTAVQELLRQLHTKLIVIRSLKPDAPPPRVQAQRLLEDAVEQAAREEATAARIAEISARFEELFPGPRSLAVVEGTPTPPPSPDTARALSAAADAAERGRAAIDSPGLFYDGRASGKDAFSGPGQSGSAAARHAARRGAVALPAAASVPPPAAGPVENCEKALAGALLSVGGLCQYSPAGASVLGGLLDAVREQFLTVEGVALNLVFMLMGIAFSALTGGIGLILKILFAVGMTAYAVYKLIPALTAAVKALWNSKEGSAERYAATRTLSGLLGGLLIMALMGAVGVKIGGALPASVGAKIASLNAKASAKLLPAGVTVMLAKFGSKPAVKPEAKAQDAIRRSGKSQARYSEEAVLRNAELPNRAARVDAAMEQLGVDRPFAEKVFAAHERVPCVVGACTPAQLRAKLEIMGSGPKAEAAIRSGLAGSAPRLGMRSPVIRDFMKKHAPDEWRRTVNEGASSGANHIDKHHSPSLPDWARDGPGSLQSRIKPDGIQFASKFSREADLKASVAELRRLIRTSVEHGPRMEVGQMSWNRPYRPAAYYGLLEKLVRGDIAEFTVQFKMKAPVGHGMGFDAAGQPTITHGLRWVRATLVRTNEGIVIKTIYPAVVAP